MCDIQHISCPHHIMSCHVRTMQHTFLSFYLQAMAPPSLECMPDNPCRDMQPICSLKTAVVSQLWGPSKDWTHPGSLETWNPKDKIPQDLGLS